MPLLQILSICALLLCASSCIQTTRDEKTNTNRERTEQREGFRQEYVDGVGIVNLKHGETIQEQEHTKQDTTEVKTVKVPVADALGPIASAMTGATGLLTGGGVLATVATAGMAFWQRSRRRKAEIEAKKERELADEAADLPPEEARQRVRDRRQKA